MNVCTQPNNSALSVDIWVSPGWKSRSRQWWKTSSTPGPPAMDHSQWAVHFAGTAGLAWKLCPQSWIQCLVHFPWSSTPSWLVKKIIAGCLKAALPPAACITNNSRRNMLCKSVIIPLISYKRYDLVINEDIFKALIIWVKTSWREMQNAFLSLLKAKSTLVALNSNSMRFSLQPEPTTPLVEMHKIQAEILWCSEIIESLCHNTWGALTLQTPENDICRFQANSKMWAI